MAEVSPFKPDRYFTVSSLTELIKDLLEDSFPDVAVEGEISNCRPSSTGHLYFSLKDQEAILNVVMFKNRFSSLSFTPVDGMKVKARGSISVYNKRGSYQLICEELYQAGLGDILAMLEERKKRLASEGLFDPALKKPLPFLPRRVGVITSPTGAALRDILQVLNRRHSGIDIIILPTPVQGEEAAPLIIEQLKTANRFKLADVIILGRGGGSLEDLLPFSDEGVVRAIAASHIPVISAVGHEIDFALSDFAADVRAPTPSAAAEMVAASREELLNRVKTFADDLSWSIQQRLKNIKEKLSSFKVENLERELRRYLQPTLLRFDDAKESLLTEMQQYLLSLRHRLEVIFSLLEASSPLAILKRGYALVQEKSSKKVIKNSNEVEKNDQLLITLAQGSLEALVKERHNHGKL